ncbi:MAG: hypothetical protein SGJ20_09215 [Planctomycetota bacterium]|nr:hypothetical protein [Planctomycetota bacterium]
MQRFVRALLLLIVLCLSLADASVASAAPRSKKKVAEPVTKSYVMPYFLVGLSITLGLLVVCRSGGRADQSKIAGLE